MRVHFSPQRSDETLTLARAGDALIINGITIDLAEVEAGDDLVSLRSDEPSPAPWPCDVLVNAGRDGEGECWFEVILPHGPNPSSATREPEVLRDVVEGQIDVPADPPPADQPEPEPDPEIDTLAAFESAIQFHVDMAARSRRYADGASLAGYVTSTVASWAAEAQAFVSWRDAVWVHAYEELAKVEAGDRDVPAIDAFIGELPVIEWPEQGG